MPTCTYEGCSTVLKPGSFIDTLDTYVERAKSVKAGQDPGRDINMTRLLPPTSPYACIFASDYGDFPLLPSSKLTAAMAVVLTWLDDAPKDKIISKSFGNLLRSSG